MSLLEGEVKRSGNPGGTPQTLIRDPKVRLQVHVQKQTKILEWLKTETYSSPDILALVVGLAHRQSLHKVLGTMQEQGVIRHAKVPVVGGHQTLWGITEHGQALAYDLSKNETPSAKIFEPGRISALRLRHILGLQKMKWQALQTGWSGWKNCDRGVQPHKRNEKFKHRPDVVTIDPAGRVVAIELELTFKTIKRYQQEVLPSHVREICLHHQYQHVLWVCASVEDTKRMKDLIIEATKRLRASDSLVMKQLDSYKQGAGGGAIFRVGSAEDWSKQWEGRGEERSKNVQAFLWRQFQETSGQEDLERQAQQQREWMPASDQGLIEQTLGQYRQALQRAEAKRIEQQQEQARQVEEANRRYAEQLAAQQEEQRRSKTLMGKVEKLFK